MELIKGLYNWPTDQQNYVATIGNFDGVHLGHQAIFQQLTATANDRALPSLVISFQPLPHEYFNANLHSQRLQTLRDRINSIAECGIDRLLLLPFNQSLASQEATAFVHDTLHTRLKIRHLLVGDDFRFGANRSGDITLLRQAAARHHFSVDDTATVMLDQSRVSSTRVRTALEASDCEQSERLLGRAHRISGRVVHGEKVGRQLGFPTANVYLKTHRPLLRGVFAVTAIRQNGESYPAVANIGERPTVGGRKLLLEVHLLDHENGLAIEQAPRQAIDLYGECLSVDFHHFIRGEKKFDSLDQLKQAISDDATTARQLLT